MTPVVMDIVGSESLNFHPNEIPVGDLIYDDPYDVPIEELIDSEEEIEVKPRLVCDEMSGPQEVVDIAEAETSEEKNKAPKRKKNLSRKKMKVNLPKKSSVNKKKRPRGDKNDKEVSEEVRAHTSEGGGGFTCDHCVLRSLWNAGENLVF